jgi:gliding motility-associated-like protein
MFFLKKIRVFCLLVAFIVNFAVTVAQNLVPNPSFEDYTNCPDDGGNVFPPQPGDWYPYLSNWVSLTAAVYFNACNTSTASIFCPGVPDNSFGRQEPRTGTGYAGIYTRGMPGALFAWTDKYLQARLSAPLQAGHWYCASFYVAAAAGPEAEHINAFSDRPLAIDRLGAYFSHQRPDTGDAAFVDGKWLNLNPQVESPAEVLLDKVGVWEQVIGVFQATGGEEWITLGCFRSDTALKRKLLIPSLPPWPVDDTTTGTACYYVEDVWVAEISGGDEFYPDYNQDTTVCNGNVVVPLYAPPGATSYRWDTGETTRVINTQPDKQYYIYEAEYDGCGIARDTIYVKHANKLLSLPADTSLCEGATLLLAPQNGATFDSYIWSTGSTANSISIADNNTIWLKVEDDCGMQSDTVVVTVNPVPPPPSSNDTVVCLADSPIVWGNVLGEGIRWYKEAIGDTGRNHPYFSSDVPGEYLNYVSQTVGGCESEREPVAITVLGATQLNLPPDTVFCPGVPVSLGVYSLSNSKYVWNTGETSVVISPEAEGMYVLTVSNSCDTVSDSIFVVFDDCIECILVPSAFSPNADGLNDFFYPLVRCPILAFEMNIFNRWGQLVYISYNPQAKWDGTYKGISCELSTYFYLISFKDYTGNWKVKKGEVTLVR